MSDANPGLRDRKRAETRLRIEKAAVAIAVSEGPEHVTIDAIVRAADISPRTFFNYFDSKEDAIVGLHDIQITDETVAAHLEQNSGVDAVTSIMRFLLGLIGPSIIDSDLHRSRMQIIRDHPQLLGRQVVQMSRMAEPLTTAVETLLAQDPIFAGEGARKSSANAELMLAICSGGARVAGREWAADGGEIDTEELEKRAITLVREVIEKLK